MSGVVATALPYCERLVANAEPWNVATNLAFAVLGGYALHRRSRAAHARRADSASAALVALPFAIAFGSALFHAYPTPLTQLLDLVPIGLFIACALGIALRRVLHAGVRGTAATLALWFAATLALAPFPGVAYGSLVYVPSLVLLLALPAVAARRPRVEPGSVPALLAIALAFAAALLVRTLDTPLCGTFATGTHPLWHVLAAVTGGLAVRLLLPAGPPLSRADGSARPPPHG